MNSSLRIQMLGAGIALAVAAAVPASAAQTMLSSQDATFVMKAGHGGSAEVADAKLALSHTSNPSVITFAKRMIADHSKANDQLASIATPAGDTPPMMGNAMQMHEHASLASLHGSAFDMAYLKSEKTAHLKTIALFKDEASDGADPKLVEFAKMTIPTLDEHLAMDEKRLSSSSM